MGHWAKSLFGKDKIGSIGIVLAGTNKKEFEKKILSYFDKTLNFKDSVYHAYLARKNNIDYPIVFNVYGAPAMIDVMTEMHDGGCRTIIFVGYAYGGFKNINIGSVVVPNQAYHFDGIYHGIRLDKKMSLPDKELKNKIENLFNKNKIKFVNGNDISVPAVSFQLPHDNKEYKKINPLTVEMELASCLSRAKEIGIRSVGVLIISDNRSKGIHEKDVKNTRNNAKTKVVKVIIDNINNFKLKPLKGKKFDLDKHLASIIHDPNDKVNVYRKK